jgi:hypothetical protein
MNSNRAVSVLLAAVAATMLITGSFGFTSVSAERGVSVNVVESENAYVGVSACEKSNGGDKGANPVWVVVTNQFSDTFVVDDVSWDDLQKARVLQPGESTTFKNAFADRSDGTVTIQVAGGLDATVTGEAKEKADCPEELKKKQSAKKQSANNHDADDADEEETEDEEEDED